MCIYSCSTFYDYKLLKNVCLFIHMVLFYSYKFSNMGIQGNENSFFAWNLKVCPKSVQNTLLCCSNTLSPPLTLNCRNSTKLPTPPVEYSPTFGWYFESSRWPRKGKPSLPNVITVVIIGANTLRFSSISCLYFLSHNRLISWLEPLIWE